jgi:hypothetical protein
MTKFIPEPGEEVLVSDFDNAYTKRIFISIVEDYYICKSVEPGFRPKIWRYAKRIEKEWIEHDGKIWPDCKMTDTVEIKLCDETTVKGTAKSWDWAHNNCHSDIISWRKV